jgi:hypothetical protein
VMSLTEKIPNCMSSALVSCWRKHSENYMTAHVSRPTVAAAVGAGAGKHERRAALDDDSTRPITLDTTLGTVGLPAESSCSRYRASGRTCRS